MNDERDHGPTRNHLSALVVDLKARAKAYQLNATQAADPTWKAMHASNALACEAVAVDIEKTLTRIDGIESTVSRARARVRQRGPSLPGGATTQGLRPEDKK